MSEKLFIVNYYNRYDDKAFQRKKEFKTKTKAIDFSLTLPEQGYNYVVYKQISSYYE